MKQIAFFILLLLTLNAVAQEKEVINFAMATHPLTVQRVYNTDTETAIVLELTNQTEGGYFCADRDVSLINIAKGVSVYDLLRSEGIPTCPDVHKFGRVGEKLVFTLYFEKLHREFPYVDIVENCDANCFAIYGIVLDKKLNQQINEAFQCFENEEIVQAVEICERIVTNYYYPYANKYFNLIHFLASAGQYEKAKKWYKRLESSSYKDTEKTLSRLMAMPYYRHLF